MPLFTILFKAGSRLRTPLGETRPRFLAGAALGFLLLAVAGAGILWLFGEAPLLRSLLGLSHPLPVYWTIPDFSLTERSGHKVTLADLAGKVWVANFIYTHCVDTCPLQTAELANIQREFAGERDFRLVSITVDPERDTPEVLNDYAKRFGADPERWLFLTGEKRAIYRLAQEGFKLSVVDPREGVRKPSGAPPTPGDPRSDAGSTFERLAESFAPRPALAHHPGPFEPFIHSSRFVLVDRRARVRGLYGAVAVLPGGPEGRYVPVYDDDALRGLRRDLRALLQEK